MSKIMQLPQLQSRNQLTTFSKGGDDVVISEETYEKFKPLQIRNTDVDIPWYSLPLQIGSKSSVKLPYGLIPVTGGTEVGKSDFLIKLGSVMPLHRVLAVEPASPDELLSAEIFNDADVAVAHLVARHLTALNDNQEPPLMVLDSIRAALFEITGSAGSKGVINAFFTATTRLSNALAMNGMTMLAVVNPMDTDSGYLAEFYQKLSSAVPGYIKLSSRALSGKSARFEGKISLRPDRLERSFSIDFNQNLASQELIESVSFEAKASKAVASIYSGPQMAAFTSTNLFEKAN